MKTINSFIRTLGMSSLLFTFSLIFSGFVMAGQFLVLNSYQEVTGKGSQLSKVISNEVIVKLSDVKGLELNRFYYNPSTGERGSVFVWKSETDWNKYLTSDLRKKLVSKVKPFVNGKVTSKGFLVYGLRH